MADIKQTQEAIEGLPDGEPLYFPRSVGSGFANAVIDSDSIKALSARLTAMEEALEKARKDVKFAMGTTGYPTVVRNYLDTILFDIENVLEGK